MDKTSKYTNGLVSNFEGLLDVIYELESSKGQNKKAYKPNSVGALGGYQITPLTFTDLQQALPSVWGKVPFGAVLKDDVGRRAASDILSLKLQRLNRLGIMPSEDNLLLAYHSGEGNVAKGTIGPIGKRYVERGLKLLGKKA